MNNLNQSAIFPKAVPIRAGNSGVDLSSQRKRKANWHRTIVKMAAWLEIIVGISFFLAFSVQSQLLFGVTPEGIGVTWAQFAGIALIGLGITSLPPNQTATRQSAARGLLVFNLAATIFFAWAAMATTYRGIILLPVVILHAVVSIALAISSRQEQS